MQINIPNNTISRNNAGFPGYLDFNTLRSRSIDYLGELTGQVWTDYNVHDPGITILEVLLYAVLDLGYRASLPAADIFARDPAGAGGEDNFFTPAQILGCNPLTITDYRKLLVDIDGVRNAWLQVANDELLPGKPAMPGQDCSSYFNYINGLYHVLLELEDGVTNTQPVIDHVKKALQSCRNFCEDFIDIRVLCKLDIGICADVELEAGVDAAQVYQDIAVKLSQFFSPAPRFYTLQELLSKNKPIETIFAGRPLQLNNSHGFVDADELEQIPFRTEIHLSDVYAILLEVAGVKTVKRLRVRSCDDQQVYQDNWKLVLPANYLPRFSVTCSGFAFYRNGIQLPVTVDQGYLELILQDHTKTLKAAAYLDSPVPQGVYRKDLGDYYSIQNEFPRVYGIGDGGLPKSASVQRQAQALQLKGYLLFFDQLLADYLMQLKNIRSLFSLQAAPDKGLAHTYFVGLPGAVPGFDQLQHGTAETGDGTSIGKNGDILAWPVRRDTWMQLVENANPAEPLIGEAMATCHFANSVQRDTAIAQWQTDFAAGNIVQYAVLALPDGSFVYYFTGTSTETVLVSRRLFKSEKEASDAAVLFIYLGNAYENYKGYYAAEADWFGFQVELSLASYLDNLQQLVENKSQYTSRRDAFLNHLLARFAEQFTDYALLWYGFTAPDQLPAAVVAGKERFLTNYPDLSSNRGRAYDYVRNGWDNDNISGFEKRVKALAGIENWNRRGLCNFEVFKYEDDYSVRFDIAGFHFFDTTAAYEGVEEATAAVQHIFDALSDKNAYIIQRTEPEGLYRICLRYDAEHLATYPEQLAAEQEAQDLCTHLQRIFSASVTAQDVMISQYIYRIRLNNDAGEQIRLSKKAYDSEAAAYAEAISELKQVNDAEKWEMAADAAAPTGKFCADNRKTPERFIDIDRFKILTGNTILGKPDKFTYELLDNNNLFHFRALAEFASEKQARSGAYRLLMLLPARDNYTIVNEKDSYTIIVKEKAEDLAACVSVFKSKKAAEQFISKVMDTVKQHYYRLQVEAIPFRWRFTYQLGYMKDNELLFQSNNEYSSQEEALQKARQFSAGITDARFETIAGRYSLESPDASVGILTCTFAGDDITQVQDNTEKEKKAGQLFELRKEINRKSSDPDPARFSENIAIHEVSKTGAYVYRLVNRAHPVAWHKLPPGADAATECKTLLNNARNGYTIAELDLGGNIIVPYTNNIGDTVYHYVLRILKPVGVLPEGTVLFESITGYSDPGSAAAAFDAALPFIMDKAISETSYGEDSFISLSPLPGTAFTYTSSQTIAFVPEETKNLLGTDAVAIIAALVKVAKAYPIRRVAKCTAEYIQRFGDSGCTAQPAATACINAQTDDGYYFVLYNKDTDTEDWQSTVTYNTATDARQAFYFFSLLLLYRGNYHADSCDGKIYLREVLAESTRRFVTADDAWGAAGIERMICVAQSDKAFQPLVNKEDCSYTFSLACSGVPALHPCHYRSQSKRDQVMQALYAAARSFITDRLFSITTEGQNQVLYGIDSKPLAIVPATQQPACVQVLDLINYVYCDQYYYTGENSGFYLGRSANDWLAKPYDSTLSQAQWKKALLQLAFYFPVVKNEQGRFCVAIRLPGFNQLPDDTPCSCGCSEEDTDACQVAWKSRCCYDNCSSAMEQFSTIARQLLVYANYQPVFDCCGCTFGIALQLPENIIAYNPQHYTTPDMVCAAIERSKDCINSEGLHVVEHVLLRPRCEEDYQCNLFAGDSSAPDCYFEWRDPGAASSVCYVPGNDPFSFIATVVMPGWPARFRKKENRLLVENLLNREAPAHVLLRVLWLAPQDFCRFEHQFKEWNRWLAKKDTCSDFTLCHFMQLLFQSSFACLDECTDCTPCTDTATVTPCTEYRRSIAAASDPDAALNQVNRLFGWQVMDCSGGRTNNIALQAGKPVNTETIQQPVEQQNETVNPKQMSRLVNNRLTQYKKNIEPVTAKIPGTQLAGQVNSFLADPDASAEKLNQLTTLVLQQTSATGIPALDTGEKDTLMQNLFAYYLDKALFKNAPVADIQAISSSISLLKEQHFDIPTIRQYWSPEQWQQDASPAAMDTIRQLLQ